MGKQKRTSEVTGLDSGWSWVIAAACCFVNCMLYGVSRMSGMLLQPAVESFGVSRGEAAVPFTTSSAVRNLSGPIVGFLGQHFGIRPVSAAGCILAALGAGLCFFATDIVWTTIFWGGIFGIGLGLSTSLLPSAINQNFKKNAATASGISYAGSFVGSFLFPPLVLFLLDEYGMRGTFLVLSGFILNSLVAVVLLKPPCMPGSTSCKKPIYAINCEKFFTDPNALRTIRISDSATLNVKCQLSSSSDQDVVTKDVQSTGNDSYNNTNSYDTLDIKELSEKSTESVRKVEAMEIDVLPKKMEISKQFLGFLTFVKNPAFAESFTKQDIFKTESAERGKQNFVKNFLLSDIVQKIREHLTTNKNHNSHIVEKSATTSGVFFELSDSERNIYLVSQLSSDSTMALITELNKNRCRRENNNSSNKSDENLIFLAVRQDSRAPKESETSTKLQKFMRWKVIGRNIRPNHSQNCSKRDEVQIPCNTTIQENSTSKSNQESESSGRSAFLDSSKTNFFGRLARSLKKTSSSRASMRRKSTSLDSGGEKPPYDASPCTQCRIMISGNDGTAALTQNNNEPENVVVTIPFTDSNHNSVPSENADKLMSENNNPQCQCAPLNTVQSEMVSQSDEEHFDTVVTSDMAVFLNKEKFLKDLLPLSEPLLLQSNCAAVLLFQSTQNNRESNSNPRISSHRTEVAKLNKENKNVPDQNQNFLDAKDAENIRHSKTGDYSTVVMDTESSKQNHLTFKRRLRSWCSVFSNPMFLLISITMAIFSFIMVCIITVIEDYARDIDHPNSPNPYVVMVLSAADLCGTLGLGWITDRGLLTRKNFIAICFFGMAASTLVIAFTTQMLTLCALVAMYGLFESGVVITFPLLTAQFIRMDKQTIAIASSNLLSAPAILLVPLVIGYFRDFMGSYHELFYLLSITSSLCGFLWLLVPFLLQKYSLKFKGRIS